MTGIAGYVYTIEFENEKYVIKISDNKELINGATYWLSKLSSLDLPIPKIYSINNQTFPCYFIMTFIPGKDLGVVYNDLTKSEKKCIARSIFKFQNEIRKLPLANGYGFLNSYEDKYNIRNSWREVVEYHIQRSENRIIQNGIFDKEYVNTVKSLLPYYRDYFNTIEPIPFFDDTTTKNVLIDHGKISGIIDFDWICFGDRLYVVALTTMSLINMQSDLDYIESWKKLEKLSEVQENVLMFYILVFCIDFMAEKGMKFNKSEIEVTNKDEKVFLENVFDLYHKKLQLTTAST